MSMDFKNTVWSSITPPYKPEPVEPTEMKRTGRFRIRTHDPATGDVTGRYLDLEKLEEVDFAGSIRFIGGTSYSFVFHHQVIGADQRRFYRGQTIAEKNRVTLVGGEWENKRIEGAEKSEMTNADTLSQNEGVWIATKP